MCAKTIIKMAISTIFIIRDAQILYDGGFRLSKRPPGHAGRPHFTICICHLPFTVLTGFDGTAVGIFRLIIGDTDPVSVITGRLKRILRLGHIL